MSLLEEWRAAAYGQDERSQAYQTFWANYFKLEEGFYASLLADETVVTGTIPSLAEKYNVDKMIMVGILDGINDSLKTPNPIETMDETTELSLDYDKEKLYYNMVEARAEWLYNLPHGINDSLKTPNPIETMDETTELSLDYDKEKLYYNMVEARAEWLYNLPQWDNLLTEERRKELYKEQKSSTTIVKAPKIGRNDPCPCGSGKKYKKCCGKNV